MSKSALYDLSIRGTRRAARRDTEPRADFLSFGALLAEVLEEHKADPETLGFRRSSEIDLLRPRSAA